MFPVELIDNLTTDAETAAREMSARAPETGQMPQSFALLARRRDEIAMALAVPAAVFDEKSFEAGEPLLAGIAPSLLNGGFVQSAQSILPLLAEIFSPLQPHAAALLSVIEAMPGRTATIIEAACTGNIDPLAAEFHIPVGTLYFLCLECLKPVFRAFRKTMGGLADDALWCRGRCPVCGGGPDYGLLKERHDPSEFIVSKSGRLWLHCCLCGHLWRFVRLVCPACGENGHDRLNILTVRGRERDRIHACRGCGQYLPVMDLVESSKKLHPDLAPLGLISLDILAAKEGYRPIVSAPWNQPG